MTDIVAARAKRAIMAVLVRVPLPLAEATAVVLRRWEWWRRG